jgi:hypothetical protein
LIWILPTIGLAENIQVEADRLLMARKAPPFIMDLKIELNQTMHAVKGKQSEIKISDIRRVHGNAFSGVHGILRFSDQEKTNLLQYS